MTLPVRKVIYPRHPAHLDPYVETLGAELAVRFLIEFSGCSVYFPADPRGRGEAEKMLGRKRLMALSERMPASRARVPVPRTWLIHALRAEGLSVPEICRSLKTTEVTVRKAFHLSPHGASHPAEPIEDDGTPEDDDETGPGQLSLF